MLYEALTVDDVLPRVPLIPADVEVFRRLAQLDQQVAREILRLRLSPFLLPQSQQGGFIIAHDDKCVRATDKRPTVQVVVMLLT
jgi:hypothetical protein